MPPLPKPTNTDDGTSIESPMPTDPPPPEEMPLATWRALRQIARDSKAGRASMDAALLQMQSYGKEIGKIRATQDEQGARLSEVDLALSDHGGRIETLEHEVRGGVHLATRDSHVVVKPEPRSDPPPPPRGRMNTHDSIRANEREIKHTNWRQIGVTLAIIAGAFAGSAASNCTKVPGVAADSKSPHAEVAATKPPPVPPAASAPPAPAAAAPGR